VPVPPRWLFCFLRVVLLTVLIDVRPETNLEGKYFEGPECLKRLRNVTFGSIIRAWRDFDGECLVGRNGLVLCACCAADADLRGAVVRICFLPFFGGDRFDLEMRQRGNGGSEVN